MKYLTPLKLSIYSVMLFSFFMLESPVIMLTNRIEPLLMGIPFLLVWNLFWWFVLTALFWWPISPTGAAQHRHRKAPLNNTKTGD
ncbi:hypothetical protein EHLJMEHL_03923 [Vreelandella titanicae]